MATGRLDWKKVKQDFLVRNQNNNLDTFDFYLKELRERIVDPLSSVTYREGNQSFPSRTELIYSIHWYYYNFTSLSLNSPKANQCCWPISYGNEDPITFKNYQRNLFNFFEIEGWSIEDFSLLTYALTPVDIKDLLDLTPEFGPDDTDHKITQASLCKDFYKRYTPSSRKPKHIGSIIHQFKLFQGRSNGPSLRERLSDNIKKQVIGRLTHAFSLEYSDVSPIPFKDESPHLFLLLVAYLNNHYSSQNISTHQRLIVETTSPLQQFIADNLGSSMAMPANVEEYKDQLKKNMNR